MSFQIYFTDELHGRERIRVCVSDSEEEFRNTTVEELKRKLIPGDQLADTILHYCFYTLEENRTLGFYGVQHEGHIIAERRIIKHEDEFTSGRKQCRCPTVEDTILRHRFKTLKENRTLGFYGVKHEGHIIAVRCRSSVTAKRPCDSLPVHGSAVKKTELDNYNLLTLEDDHTLGFGIKHEDEITAAETASSGLPSSRTAERHSMSPRNSCYLERRSCGFQGPADVASLNVRVKKKLDGKKS
ncbi:uncharacterized protein LOC120484222 isoform X2 [Pimephales promelas]|uniref:uncharacterized protein LOC120484222 isoform X2 n=1 Tax=Pimephales promelas TaxID=90988 RepID=UPI0019557249|nr:uncharacterized protein LOC120484222 isoform X2 [Pimephales promelas]